ncbi:MAG TPA: preprotein translocase subunit YajC [Rugosimonospora sp.]|nr:preprotein translocase subunit YajC [Rugosimonospora sp.]
MYLAASGGGSGLTTIFLFILIPVALYFLMIRPQQRRAKEAQQMQNTLGPGAEVMTSSGIYGTVAGVDTDEGTVSLEVSPEVYLTIARGAISKVITPAPTDESETDDDVDSDTESAVTPTLAEESNPVIERRKD